MFGLSYKEWSQREDEWRKEMMLRLMSKRMQTVDDMEVQAQLSTEDMTMSQSQETDQKQSADMELSAVEAHCQESGEATGIDAGAAPDAGFSGSMDSGFAGGTDGGMDGGCSM